MSPSSSLTKLSKLDFFFSLRPQAAAFDLEFFIYIGSSSSRTPQTGAWPEPWFDSTKPRAQPARAFSRSSYGQLEPTRAFSGLSYGRPEPAGLIPIPSYILLSIIMLLLHQIA